MSLFCSFFIGWLRNRKSIGSRIVVHHSAGIQMKRRSGSKAAPRQEEGGGAAVNLEYLQAHLKRDGMMLMFQT